MKLMLMCNCSASGDPRMAITLNRSILWGSRQGNDRINEIKVACEMERK